MKAAISALFVLFLCFTGLVKAQSTVIFSDDFDKDSINSLAVRWEVFGTAAIGKVQFDSGTTNKILRINPGATTPNSYGGIRLQKTLPFSYGQLMLSYNIRTNRLPQAVNSTNCGNFNRWGLGGIANVSNTDNNTVNSTTAVTSLGLQGSYRPSTGLAFAPTGNFTPVNNVWYQVKMNVSRISATKILVSGTIKRAADDSLIKTISGTITTITPTLLLNQFIIDITAIYHYNTLDLDNMQLALPDSVPAAANLAINGIVETLQTLNATYTLTGSDTAGSRLQWFTAPTANGPFTAIPGAVSALYTTTKNDQGKYLAFRVYPASGSGLVTGLPVTVVTATPVKAHNGPVLIASIRQTGAVAAQGKVHIQYTYQHPNNIPEKNTAYTVFVADSFNVGYYKKLFSSTTTASLGIDYAIDTSLVGKYLYIELLPQDSLGNYGLYSGWTAQTAVQPEIQVLDVQYWKQGQLINDYGIDSGAITISAYVKNNHPNHDTVGRLLVQLIDGFGNLVTTSQSDGTVLLRNAQAKLTAQPISVPANYEGYSIKVVFADSLNASVPIAAAERLAEPEDVNTVYQYFMNDGDSVRGAYLWIPPHTKTIKGIMICINNNIERQIQENPEVRKVAAKWGLASLVLNTFRNSLLAPPNNLSFDFTIPSAAAKMDSIINAFAQMSNHPELVNSPFIPMAHSAYMDFPFHVAMRDNTKCIAAIPIKSGVPNIYTYYKGKTNGGSSNLPATNNNMKDVPILFYQGFLPETVDALYKTSPFRPHKQSLGAGFTGIYRNDDGTGIYKQGMEYGGYLLEMYEGHFNALPRAMHVLAMFIDKACGARLPDNYPTNPADKPVLKPLDFTKGWLVDQNYFNAKDTTKYTKPAPYSQYAGNKKGTAWYLDEELARTCEQLAVSEYFKKVEQFSINKPDSTVDTLYQCVYNYHPKDGDKYTDSTGIMRLKVTSFSAPWPIDTALANNKDSLKVPMKLSTNVLLPGVTSLPITNLPFRTNTKASCYKHLGNLVFKLKFSRFQPSPGGYTQSYVSVYREGNDTVAASLRNIRLDRTQSTMLGFKPQSINFPPIAPIDVNTRSLTLKATASSGLPVDFIVRNGPAVVVGNQLYITQLHEGMKFPIAIVVSACQVGTTGKTTGIYAAGPVYRTIWLDNIAPAKPLELAANLGSGIAVNLSWTASKDTNVNGYSVWRDDKEIAIVTNSVYKDSTVLPAASYTYYVRALNKYGNYSDSSNQVWITTNAPLPLDINQFTAKMMAKNKVLCQWQMSKSSGKGYFEVERSDNGSEFRSIGKVFSKNQVGESYQWEDVLPQPFAPAYYYRIKVIDQDGSYHYSKMEQVITNTATITLQASPNPFKDHINLVTYQPKKADATISIYSTNGKLVYQSRHSLIQGQQSISLHQPAISSLSKGFYLLTLTTDLGQQVIRLEK